MARICIVALFVAASLAASNLCVTADYLNVRTGPGSSYKTTGSALKKGTKVTSYEVKNNWHRIGTNKWCSGKYLSKCSNTDKPVEKPVDNGSKTGVKKCTTASVNVRKGPSTSFKVLETYGTGVQVTVYETTGSWARIGTDRWLSTKYIGECPSTSGDRRKCPSFWNKYSKNTYPSRSQFISGLASLLNKNIIYTQNSVNRWHGINNNVCPPSVPKYSDCSAFATWFYWTAFGGLTDSLSNANWKYGNTQSMHHDSNKISLDKCQPGDYILYAKFSPKYSGHAVIYIGNNKVITYGSSEGKSSPVNQRDKVHYRSDFRGCYSVNFPFGKSFK